MTRHRQRITAILIVFAGVFTIDGYSVIYADDNQLSTEYATLTIKNESNLIISRNQDGSMVAQTLLSDLWKIIIKNNDSGIVTTLTPSEDVIIRSIQDRIELVYEDVGVDNLSILFSISTKENSFCFSGHIVSEFEKWTIKELHYPNIHEIQLPDEKMTVYWPRSLSDYVFLR